MRAGTSARGAGHWAVLAGAFLAAVGLLLAGWLLVPDPRGVGTHEQLGLRPCVPMALFGVPCPGCGVTTSVVLAARGRVFDSLANQPFGLAVALALAAALPAALVGHLAGRDLGRVAQRLARGRLVLVAGAAMLAAWIYKIWLVRGG